MEEYELHIIPEPETTSIAAKVISAVVVMAAIAAGVFLLNPRKTAEVTVVKVELYSPHTETQAAPGVGQEVGVAPTSEDDLYVVATVNLTNKLRLPISPNSPSATLTTADGALVDASFAAAHDMPRLEQEFPALTTLVNGPGGTPIESGETIAPSATREGKVVLYFPNVTAAMWQKKKAALLTINLFRQKPLTVSLP
jgi:hypothetical protein